MPQKECGKCGKVFQINKSNQNYCKNCRDSQTTGTSSIVHLPNDEERKCIFCGGEDSVPVTTSQQQINLKNEINRVCTLCNKVNPSKIA